MAIHTSEQAEFETVPFSNQAHLTKLLTDHADTHYPTLLGLFHDGNNTLMTTDSSNNYGEQKRVLLPYVDINPTDELPNMNVAAQKRFGIESQGRFVGHCILKPTVSLVRSEKLPRLFVPVAYELPMTNTVLFGKRANGTTVWRAPQECIRVLDEDSAHHGVHGQQRRAITRIAISAFAE